MRPSVALDKASPLLGICALFFLCALPVAVQAAGRADQKQPMQIESDALRYEDSSQRSIFSGNVNLNKGSIVMRGANLEVKQDAAGNQLGTLTGSAKQPAYFRQQREGRVNEFVEAQAATIAYNSATAVVTLTGNARFTRLQGSTALDTVTGAVIVYNGNSDVFTVNGGSASGVEGQPASSGARVRVTLTSRGEAAAPATSAATSAAPAATPEPVRKPGLQLQSGGGQ